MGLWTTVVKMHERLISTRCVHPIHILKHVTCSNEATCSNIWTRKKNPYKFEKFQQRAFEHWTIRICKDGAIETCSARAVKNTCDVIWNLNTHREQKQTTETTTTATLACRRFGSFRVSRRRRSARRRQPHVRDAHSATHVHMCCLASSPSSAHTLTQTLNDLPAYKHAGTVSAHERNMNTNARSPQNKNARTLRSLRRASLSLRVGSTYDARTENGGERPTEPNSISPDLVGCGTLNRLHGQLLIIKRSCVFVVSQRILNLATQFHSVVPSCALRSNQSGLANPTVRGFHRVIIHCVRIALASVWILFRFREFSRQISKQTNHVCVCVLIFPYRCDNNNRTESRQITAQNTFCGCECVCCVDWIIAHTSGDHYGLRQTFQPEQAIEMARGSNTATTT